MADEMPTLVVKSSAPVSVEAGPFEFRMMSRRVGEDHGGTLEVYGSVDGATSELLKFDCFARAPHWHRCYPGRKDEIEQLAPASAAQTLDFALETLRTRFGPLIAEQGFAALSPAAAASDLDAALAQVATTMAELIQRDPATL